MTRNRFFSALHERQPEPTPASVRRFALTLLIGLPAAGLIWLGFLRVATEQWLFKVPAGFCLAALLLAGTIRASPAVGRRVFIGWHIVTRTVEALVSAFLLLVVFYLVVTPIGLLRRLRPSGFNHHLKRTIPTTYWQDVPPVKDPSLYYRQF